jgi:hypothetical protein
MAPDVAVCFISDAALVFSFTKCIIIEPFEYDAGSNSAEYG